MKHKLLGACLLAGLLGLPWLAAPRQARAQSVAALNATGVWTGSLPDGRQMELRLDQESAGTVSGYGLITSSSAPVYMSVQGEMSTTGLILLQGTGFDGQSVVTTELQLAGDTAQARLLEAQQSRVSQLTLSRQPAPPAGGSTTLRLWNNDLTPFQTYSPPEQYHIDYQILPEKLKFTIYNMHVDVRLAGSLLTELAGSWTLNETSDSQGNVPAIGSLRFRSGRVSAWNFVLDPKTSIMLLKTPDTLTTLSRLRFDRLSNETYHAYGLPDLDERVTVCASIAATGVTGCFKSGSTSNLSNLGFAVTLVSK